MSLARGFIRKVEAGLRVVADDARGMRRPIRLLMGWAGAAVRALGVRRWAVLDGLCAVGLAAIGVIVVLRGPDAVDERTVVALVLVLALCLPVAWRRRAPAVVLAVTALSAVGLAAVGRPSLPAVLTPALGPVLAGRYGAATRVGVGARASPWWQSTRRC